MTVTSSVGFCLGVGALSLIVSMIFGGQGIGSAAGTLKMQKIWATMKRHSKALAALAGLLLPTLAFGQPEQAGGGEANLMLPDLKAGREFFRHERACAADDRDCCSAPAACCSAWRSMCS